MGAFRRLLIALPISLNFSVALRGTIAVGTPLLGLSALGHPLVGLLATVGALQSTMADVGGSYRGRVLTLLLACLLIPAAATAASLLVAWWWAVTLGMVLLALAIGLARSFGQLGTSLGFATGVAYLIGTAIHGHAIPALLHASALLLGCLWTLLVALAFWQLRPYKRLEYEVAECFARAAALTRCAGNFDFSASDATIAARHQALRQAIERARSAIGEVSSGTDGSSLTLPRLLVLARSAARIGANVVTLADLRREQGGPADPAQALYLRAVEALAQASLRLAHQLARGRAELELQGLEERLSELRGALTGIDAQTGATEAQRLNLRHALSVLERTVLHLRNAAEVLQELFGGEHDLGNRLLPRLYIGDLMRRGRQALRINLTPRSLILRHALRLALASGLATLCYSLPQLPHGLWIPLSVLVLLQPDFGGTRTRAVQRTLGTILGVGIAGVLLTLIHNRLLIELALLPLIFFTLLFLRSRYTLGVTLLTPFVILLLELIVPGGLAAIAERVADTVAGATLALLAGYWLWPSWQRERLPEQIAQSLQSNRAYAHVILEHLRAGEAFDQALHALRHQAELAAANTGAAYQNLLAEPAHMRGDVPAMMGLVSYGERLTRHLTSLGEHLGAPITAYPPNALRLWSERLDSALGDIAQTVAGQRSRRPELTLFESADASLREAAPSGSADARAQRLLIGALLDKISTDVSALYGAALRLRPLPREEVQNSDP